MVFSHWLTIATICILGAMSPGPSLAVVLKNTLNGSRFLGVLTSLGHGLGVGIYATISVLGLAIVLTGQPVLFKGIQIIGALYLLWLGINAFRSKSAFGQEHSTDTSKSPVQAFTSGFLISFLNPKIAIFFLALFSQFVDPDSALTTKLVYSMTAAVIDAAWYIFIAVAVSHSVFAERLRHYSVYLDKILAVLLVGIGIRLLLGIL